jgi:hypothetical protein
MMKPTTGNRSAAGTEGMVNTIDCVGVMGRGIGL